MGGWDRPVVTAPSRKRTGRGQRKVDLFSVGTDEAKLTVMRRLAVTEPGPGYTHIPADREAEWFHQITAEKLVTKYIKGVAKREWHQTRPRNEALDCRVYAYAALKIASPNIRRHAERLKAMSEDEGKEPEKKPTKKRDKPEPVEEPLPAEGQKPKRKTRRRTSRSRKSWVNHW